MTQPDDDVDPVGWLEKAVRQQARVLADARSALTVVADRLDEFAYDELATPLEDVALDPDGEPYEPAEFVGDLEAAKRRIALLEATVGLWRIEHGDALAATQGEAEGLQERAVWAILDKTCDLADRTPPEEAVAEVVEMVGYAMPTVRAALATAYLAGRDDEMRGRI